jgi:hypothetical protein
MIPRAILSSDKKRPRLLCCLDNETSANIVTMTGVRSDLETSEETTSVKSSSDSRDKCSLHNSAERNDVADRALAADLAHIDLNVGTLNVVCMTLSRCP